MQIILTCDKIVNVYKFCHCLALKYLVTGLLTRSPSQPLSNANYSDSKIKMIFIIIVSSSDSSLRLVFVKYNLLLTVLSALIL